MLAVELLEHLAHDVADVVLLVADQIYALQTIDGTYVSGGPIDSLYLVAYLSFGAAVAHPSMRHLTDPHPVAVTWLGPVRLVGLAAAMITGPLLVTIGPDAERYGAMTPEQRAARAVEQGEQIHGEKYRTELEQSFSQAAWAECTGRIGADHVFQ